MNENIDLRDVRWLLDHAEREPTDDERTRMRILGSLEDTASLNGAGL